MKIILPKKEKHSIGELLTGQTFLYEGKLYLKIKEVYDAEKLDSEVNEFHDITNSNDIETPLYCAVNLENGCLSSLPPSTSCELVATECNVKFI